MGETKITLVNFGAEDHWTLENLSDIIQKVKAYVEEKKYEQARLESIEDSTWNDPDNQRYNISIVYTNGRGHKIRQQLMLLKGELIDGEEFHKRFSEFYDR